MLEVLRSLGGGARPRRLDPAVVAWIWVLELLSIRYLCISLVESYKPDYNVSTPVDLNSPSATQLRTELESARAEMRVAKVKLDSAREINEDGSFQNPDGAYAHRVAAHDYRSAMENYRQALTAWVNHLLDL